MHTGREEKAALDMGIDTRAGPHVTMSTQPPALTCSCITCDVEGWYLPHLDSTVYVYGLRILSEFNDREARTLRAEWKRSMRHEPNAQTMVNEPLRYRDARFRREAGDLLSKPGSCVSLGCHFISAHLSSTRFRTFTILVVGRTRWDPGRNSKSNFFGVIYVPYW